MKTVFPPFVFRRMLCLFAFLSLGLAWAQSLLELNIGMYRIEAEVAFTPQSRAQGLMHRKEMAAHHGMLFVFPESAIHCMWMKNTDLPLAVAFLDEQGTILNIEEMQPHTETSHCAAKAARYALEMNKGWFKRINLGAGSLINGVSKAPAGR